MTTKLWLKYGLVAAYVSLLILPGYIFFHDRGGLSFVTNLPSLQAGLQLMFPLFGLYAFTLVAMQAMIGPNVNDLRVLFANIRHFHQIEGLFAASLMIIHPTMILLGFGLVDYYHRHFVSPSLRVWVLPAYVGLTILVTSITTAVLAWRGLKIGWWRILHRFNYLAFILLWFHSWFIGSDVRSTNLRYVWLLYLIVVTGSAAYKYRSVIQNKPSPNDPKPI